MIEKSVDVVEINAQERVVILTEELYGRILQRFLFSKKKIVHEVAFIAKDFLGYPSTIIFGDKKQGEEEKENLKEIVLTSINVILVKDLMEGLRQFDEYKVEHLVKLLSYIDEQTATIYVNG